MTLNNGFLLVEFAVVMAVLSLLIGVGIPTLQLFDRAAVRSEIEQLITAINRAQHRALLTGQLQEIQFLEHGYRSESDIHELSSQVMLGVGLDAKGSLHKSRDAVTHAVTFANKTITCCEQGVANGGTVYFTNRDRTMSYAVSLPVGSCYRNIYAWVDGHWVLQ